MSRYGNMKLYHLILVLAVLLTFTGGWASKAEGSNLTDLGEAEWARQAITEMEASGIVAGYPGGAYLPYNNVTKLESVAMLIRMLGLEDQAREAEETGADYEMPPDLYWGSGYLIMAVEQGMLDEDYLYLLQPNVPATRTEVAMLAFHALKLSPVSDALDFEDAGEIPGDFRDGVAAVVKSGIMEGYPGNVFKPNDNINRAQIAVMMSNIVDLDYADPCPDRRADGTVMSVDPGSRVITVEPAGSIFYTAGCDVFLDGASILPDGLKVGDEVEIILDGDGQAVYISALRPAENQSYKGIVSSLKVIGGSYWLSITSDDGKELTRQVAENVKLSIPGGNELNISSLNKGDYVEVLVSGIKIIEVKSLAVEYGLKGVIRELDFSGTLGITLRTDDGKTTKYEVSEFVEVELDGKSIDFDDLREGYVVRMEQNSRKQVINIEVVEHDTDQLEGVIRDIDTLGNLGLTIRSDGGDLLEYRVVSSVEVEDEDGDEIKFKDLNEGERVILELDSSGRVDYIRQVDIEAMEGEIRELDTTGDYGITIRTSNRVKEYEVNSDVEVNLDGEYLYFNQLKKGQQVRVELDGSGRVDYIEVIEDLLNVSGKVSDLVKSRPEFIRIQRSSGTTSQYYLTNITDYYRDGDRIDMSDIVIGAEVELRLYGDNVKRLDITNDEDIIITGTVYSIDEDEEIIRLSQVSGNRFVYELTRGAILRDHDGWSIDLDEIEEGQEIRINLVDGEITRLTVLD